MKIRHQPATVYRLHSILLTKVPAFEPFQLRFSQQRPLETAVHPVPAKTFWERFKNLIFIKACRQMIHDFRYTFNASFRKDFDESVTAYHELGHALVRLVGKSQIEKITLVPEDKNLAGYILSVPPVQPQEMPSALQALHWLNIQLKALCSNMAGLAAEKLFLSDFKVTNIRDAIQANRQTDIAQAREHVHRIQHVLQQLQSVHFIWGVPHSVRQALLTATPEKLLMEAAKTARKILQTFPESTLKAMVQALKQAKELNGQAVDAFFEQHLGKDFDWKAAQEILNNFVEHPTGHVS